MILCSNLSYKSDKSVYKGIKNLSSDNIYNKTTKKYKRKKLLRKFTVFNQLFE